MIEMHRNKYDWSKHVWAYQETVQPFEYSYEEHGSAEEEAGEASPNEVEEEIESTPVSAAIKRKNKSEPSAFTTPVTYFRPEIFNRPSLNNIDDPEMVRVEHEMSEKLKEKVYLGFARVAQEMKQKLKIATVAMVVVGAIVGIWTSLTV
ncbi:hypothetical protein Bca4012_043027 [Brassica carinata]